MKSPYRADRVALVAIGVLALAGCAPEPGTPAPAPTVTVTASPAPRSAADPLTALDAWLACSSAVQGNYSLNYPGTKIVQYDATAVTADSAGAFIVKVDFQPPGGTTTNFVPGAEGVCTVSGTVGEPVIKEIAFTDFG